MAVACRKVNKQTGLSKVHRPRMSAAAPNHGCEIVRAQLFHLLTQLGSTGSH